MVRALCIVLVLCEAKPNQIPCSLHYVVIFISRFLLLLVPRLYQVTIYYEYCTTF